MKRWLFLGILISSPALGVITKNDEMATHIETGGMGDAMLRFHPFIETEYQYDSNINYLDHGAQSDHVGILRPGFSTVWSNGETAYVELMYQLEIEEFLRNTNLDTLNHTVNAKADWNWDPVYLFLRENYLNTNDRSYTTITQLIQRQDDQQLVTAGWNKNELTLEVQGEHFSRSYADVLTPFNYSTYGVSPTATWDWNESQQMIADVSWDRVVYQNDATRTGHLFHAEGGWDFHPTDEFKTRILGGYGSRQFDGANVADFEGFIAAWTIDDTRLYGRGHVHAGYETSEQESINDAASGYFQQQLFDASFSFDVTSKVVPSVNASWARQYYGNDETDSNFTGHRDDDVTGAGLQLSYALSDHLSIVPSYSFQHRASNVPSQSYNNHTASLTCRYGL